MNDGYACANERCNRYIDPDFVQSIDWAPDGSNRILIRWTCECSGDRVKTALYILVPRLLFVTMRGAAVQFPYYNVNHVSAVQENDPALCTFQELLDGVEGVDDLEAAWNSSVPPPEPSI